jgi:serine acetyltransferase
VTIGSDVIVGAGSLVAKNVGDRMVVAGNPAREVCSLDEWLTHRANDPSVIRTVETPSNLIETSVGERLREATASSWMLN